MATSTQNQPPALIEETLTKIEHDLELKERQLAQEYGKRDVDIDIAKHLKTLKSSSLIAASNPTSEMNARLKLEEKRKKAKANYDLITKTEPMKIPSEKSDDKSLLNAINTLDSASNKLPALIDDSSLSRMHRADVSIKSSNDAWIYSLNPSVNLVLPKKLQTNTASTTDFLLCDNHQKNLDKFAKTIKSLYGREFDAQPPTDRVQFHLNLYGPVLNRLNVFIQQLKTKAAESEQSDIKNIYEIMIDTNIMFKASIILYERYLNPINIESFFLIILAVLKFAAAHEAEIISGLQAFENITLRVLDLCLILATRLLVLTRIVLQTFFGFFAIQFNMIYKNSTANAIWEIISPIWTQIIAAILIITSIVIGVVCGIVCLTYKAYKWLTFLQITMSYLII